MQEKVGNGHTVDLERLLEDIKAVLRDGQELLKAGASKVRETACAKAESTGQLAREKPYQTMAVVFGAGLVVGLLASGFFSRGPKQDD